MSTVYCQSNAACDAYTITINDGGNATVYGSTVGMPIAVPSLCNTGVSGTVWYHILPEANTNVLISTCGDYTNFDTYLGVYKGPCDLLQCVAANDDGDCPNFHYWDDDDDSNYDPSTLGFISDGSEYYIAVTGYSHGSSGNYELTVSYYNNVEGGCNSAKDIPGPYSSPVVVNGTLSNQRVGASVCDDLDYYDLGTWFVIHPELNKEMNISTCAHGTEFDTRLAILSGGCSALQCDYENDDDSCSVSYETSTITFLPTLSEYLVLLTAYDDDEAGDYVLTIKQSSVVQNTPCVNAFPLQLGVSGNPEGTNMNGPVITSSICGNEVGNAIWYKVTSSMSETVTFSTCNSATNFDTVLSVYSGSCSALSCVVTNDDYCSSGSSVTVDIEYNQILYLVITGYNGAIGDYRIDYTLY